MSSVKDWHTAVGEGHSLQENFPLSQMLIGQYKGQPVAWYLDCGKITFEWFAGSFSEKF